MTKGLTLRFVKRAQRQTVSLYLPCGSAGKESACNVGDLGSIPRLGRSPGEGKGYPFQYSGLENSMDCIIHGVEESDTTERLSHANNFNNLDESDKFLGKHKLSILTQEETII